MSCPINIRELLVGDVGRLANVFRFSSVRCVKRETTAEHVFFTTWYSYILAMHCNLDLHMDLNIGEVLERGMLHDLEEARTGDINRLFKYTTPDLKREIDAAAQMHLREMMLPLLPESAEAFASSVVEVWGCSKDDSYEGLVVRLADYMSVLSYMWSELTCANYTMFRYQDDMLQYSQTFDCSEYDFIRPVVDEIQRITIRLFTNPELRRAFDLE